MTMRSAAQTESYPSDSACRAASIKVLRLAALPETGRKMPNFISAAVAFEKPKKSGRI
jgi:hypothetical protein